MDSVSGADLGKIAGGIAACLLLGFCARAGYIGSEVNKHNQLGVRYAQSGNYNAAISELTQAIHVAEDDPLYPEENKAGLYFSRSNAYFAIANWSLALADIERAVRLGDHSPLTINKRATARAMAGDYDGAISDYQMLGNSGISGINRDRVDRMVNLLSSAKVSGKRITIEHISQITGL